MGQLLTTKAPLYDIGLCAIGHLSFESIRDAFQLDDDQYLVHSFLGGRISEDQKHHVAPLLSGALAKQLSTGPERPAT